jgi:hypothetical protein
LATLSTIEQLIGETLYKRLLQGTWGGTCLQIKWLVATATLRPAWPEDAADVPAAAATGEMFCRLAA